jgi:D-alanyl-lipoteichoic acid acyltransferase DltB (MBOAT superfamily)
VGNHLDWPFWALVVGIGVGLRMIPVRRTGLFGLANLGALIALFGTEVAAAAAGIAAVLWVLLRIAKSSPEGIGWVAGRLAYLVPVGLFFAYKAAGDVPVVKEWVRAHEPWPQVHAILIGLSFSYAALRCVDATHCVMGKGAPLLDPVGLVGYLFPFHMIVAGPIGAYDQHVKLDAGPLPEGPGRLLAAANDLSTGLVYKHVAAEYLRVFLFTADPTARVESHSLIDTAALFVYVFFDFAGYSRIALAAGTLMGVPTPENFRAPFVARNVTDFFARWHVSLGSMVQRNLYVPLQLRLVRRFGVRRSVWLALVTLVVCWVFVGLWHRLTWRFALYGVTFAVVVWAEKNVLDRRWLRPARRGSATAWVRRALGMIYVFVTVTLMLHVIMNELLNP